MDHRNLPNAEQWRKQNETDIEGFVMGLGNGTFEFNLFRICVQMNTNLTNILYQVNRLTG